MLDQAQEKIREQGWTHITLRQMDALNLSFPDDSFDYVMAFHVVSVVPDATRLLDEARRVLRPNGTLVVINHFRSERPIIGSLVEMADPSRASSDGGRHCASSTCSTVRRSRSSGSSRPRPDHCSPWSSPAIRRRCGRPVESTVHTASGGVDKLWMIPDV
jgi:SAM-dependent methyltransferase